MILSGQEKIDLLKNIATNRSIRTFVETGTFDGDTAAEMASVCDTVYTVELSREFYDRCRLRFEHNSRVHLAFADSAKWIPGIVACLRQPALFWLDAHHSDVGSAGSHDTCPLLEELRAIYSRPHRHVVLVDDARFFGVGNWPTLEVIQAFAKGYHVELVNDIVRIS